MTRKTKPVIERVLERIVLDEYTGCWEWTGAQHEHGYGIIGLGRREDGIDRVHRVTYRHYVGDIPDGMFVLHRCDNRQCCNPKHLFLGSAGDNSRDMVEKGRFTTPNARLNVQQVEAIRGSTLSAHLLAQRHGVRPRQIRRIRDRSRWKHHP